VASIKKRPDGRWRARYRDPAGHERAGHFPTRAKAQAWLDEKTASLITGTHVDRRRSQITVGDWADQWIAGRVHLKAKTFVGYESLLKTQIRPHWSTVPLSGVAHADVVVWVASMRSDGLSASRVRQAYHLLHSMLDAAVRDRRLASNPAAGVDLPRLPRKERRYLDHTQVAALADACGDYRVLVLTLAYTGLRWGEAAGLRVRRIDTMRGRLEVVETMVEVNGAVIFGPPKTHQTRSVPVPAFLRDELVQQIAGRGADELAFTASRGGVLRVGNFRRSHFDGAARSVGLDGLVPHELRHTAASLAIASGASVKGVQAILGHASATLTLDRYGHLFGDELDAVADRIDIAARAAADSSRTSDGPNVFALDTRTA
jgi:integrase